MAINNSKITRTNKKKVKSLKKEIDKLKKTLKRTEIRPCHGDNDLKAREEEILSIEEQIRHLDREYDRLMYSWWKKREDG
jgi:hypothetical protein